MNDIQTPTVYGILQEIADKAIIKKVPFDDNTETEVAIYDPTWLASKINDIMLLLGFIIVK